MPEAEAWRQGLVGSNLVNWLFPLRRIIPLALLLLSLPFAAVMHVWDLRRADREIVQQLTASATHSGDQLTAMLRDPLTRGDWSAAHHTLESAGTTPDLRWAAVTDAQNRVVLSTDDRLLQHNAAALPDAPPVSLIAAARHRRMVRTRLSADRNILWAIYPLPLPRSAGGGVLILTFDSSTLMQSARTEAMEHAAGSVGGSLLLAVLIWVYLRLAVVNRIERLTAAIHNWRFGNKDIPYIGGHDEIAQMAGQFTTLTRELAEQNHQLHALFERSFQFIALLAPDGTVLDVNDLALEFADADKETVLDRKFWATPWWSHDPDGQRQLQQDIVAAAAGTHVRRDVIHVAPDAVAHYVDFSLRPIRNQHGQVQWLLAEGHDVTPLKEAEQRSRRLSAFYATLSHTNTAIVRSRSTEELFPLICRIAVELGELKGAWIGMRDAKSRSIDSVASAGIDADYLAGLGLSFDPDDPRSNCPTVTALRVGSNYVCNDFLNDPRTAPWHERARASGIGASAAFPLHRGNEVVGALTLYAAEPGLFTADLIGLLDEMVQDISFALDNFARQEELQLAATVFDSSRELITITDADGVIISVNRAFCDVTGYAAGEVVGRPIGFLKSGRHEKAFYQKMWQSINSAGYWQGELWNRRKNGELYPAWVSISAVRNEAGQVNKYISVSADITESKQAEDRIRYLAYFDPLTDLPNRTLLRDRTGQLLLAARREQRSAALLYLDVDNFKNINDSLGHLAGDQLLQEVARRIAHAIADTDAVGRPGGDEFLIILGEADAAAAMHTAQQLLSAIAQPYATAEQPLNITASIGIAVFPRDGEDFDELHKNADIALYKAKELGRNRYHFFTQELNSAAMERLTLENALRSALGNGELVLHYQPQVDIDNSRIFGVEALLRWTHPQLGAVPPDRFIPIAEETGLIGTIGEWVMFEACRQTKAWQQAGLPPISVAVNASTRQFTLCDMYQTVSRALNETGVAPELLEVEITESLLAQDLETTLEVLRRIKALGVRIAVDDFGTGYSSLAYLKRFPIDKLKIDQSFVRDLETDLDDRAIAAGVINLGHSLGLTVIAEGIETEEQQQLLRGLGCDEAQGYLFSRPLSADALAELLQKQLADNGTKSG